MLGYIVVLVSVAFAVWTLPDWLRLAADLSDSHTLLTPEQLSLCTGTPHSKGLYLSVLGQVFDVEKGRKHYGPGGSYHFFTGRDASKAFVTGDFSEAGLTDDVSTLTPAEIVVLYDWLAFYQKDYTPVGRLIGRFYSESGKPTELLLQVEASLAQGLKQKAQTDKENQLYPACNSEWSSTTGGRVWCSRKSGGVLRDWTGVPRLVFSPGSGSTRCVCVQLSDHMYSTNPNLREYKNCPPDAESCLLNQD